MSDSARLLGAGMICEARRDLVSACATWAEPCRNREVECRFVRLRLYLFGRGECILGSVGTGK